MECPLCPERLSATYSDFKSYQEHLTEVHAASAVDYYACPYCQEAVRGQDALEEHLFLRHDSRPYEGKNAYFGIACSDCGLYARITAQASNEEWDAFTSLMAKHAPLHLSLLVVHSTEPLKRAPKFRRILPKRTGESDEERECPHCRITLQGRMRMKEHLIKGRCKGFHATTRLAFSVKTLEESLVTEPEKDADIQRCRQKDPTKMTRRKKLEKTSSNMTAEIDAMVQTLYTDSLVAIPIFRQLSGRDLMPYTTDGLCEILHCCVACNTIVAGEDSAARHTCENGAQPDLKCVFSTPSPPNFHVSCPFCNHSSCSVLGLQAHLSMEHDEDYLIGWLVEKKIKAEAPEEEAMEVVEGQEAPNQGNEGEAEEEPMENGHRNENTSSPEAPEDRFEPEQKMSPIDCYLTPPRSSYLPKEEFFRLCRLCMTVMPADEDAYKIHMENHTEEERQLVSCPECSLMVPNGKDRKVTYRKHLVDHVKTNVLCVPCMKSYVDMTRYFLHLVEAHNVDLVHYCTRCNIATKSVERLQDHIYSGECSVRLPHATSKTPYPGVIGECLFTFEGNLEPGGDFNVTLPHYFPQDTELRRCTTAPDCERNRSLIMVGDEASIDVRERHDVNKFWRVSCPMDLFPVPYHRYCAHNRKPTHKRFQPSKQGIKELKVGVREVKNERFGIRGIESIANFWFERDGQAALDHIDHASPTVSSRSSTAAGVAELDADAASSDSGSSPAPPMESPESADVLETSAVEQAEATTTPSPLSEASPASDEDTSPTAAAAATTGEPAANPTAHLPLAETAEAVEASSQPAAATEADYASEQATAAAEPVEEASHPTTAEAAVDSSQPLAVAAEAMEEASQPTTDEAAAESTEIETPNTPAEAYVQTIDEELAARVKSSAVHGFSLEWRPVSAASGSTSRPSSAASCQSSSTSVSTPSSPNTPSEEEEEDEDDVSDESTAEAEEHVFTAPALPVATPSEATSSQAATAAGESSRKRPASPTVPETPVKKAKVEKLGSKKTRLYIENFGKSGQRLAYTDEQRRATRLELRVPNEGQNKCLFCHSVQGVFRVPPTHTFTWTNSYAQSFPVDRPTDYTFYADQLTKSPALRVCGRHFHPSVIDENGALTDPNAMPKFLQRTCLVCTKDIMIGLETPLYFEDQLKMLAAVPGCGRTLAEMVEECTKDVQYVCPTDVVKAAEMFPESIPAHIREEINKLGKKTQAAPAPSTSSPPSDPETQRNAMRDFQSAMDFAQGEPPTPAVAPTDAEANRNAMRDFQSAMDYAQGEAPTPAVVQRPVSPDNFRQPQTPGTYDALRRILIEPQSMDFEPQTPGHREAVERIKQTLPAAAAASAPAARAAVAQSAPQQQQPLQPTTLQQALQNVMQKDAAPAATQPQRMLPNQQQQQPATTIPAASNQQQFAPAPGQRQFAADVSHRPITSVPSTSALQQLGPQAQITAQQYIQMNQALRQGQLNHQQIPQQANAQHFHRQNQLHLAQLLREELQANEREKQKQQLQQQQVMQAQNPQPQPQRVQLAPPQPPQQLPRVVQPPVHAQPQPHQQQQPQQPAPQPAPAVQQPQPLLQSEANQRLTWSLLLKLQQQRDLLVATELQRQPRPQIAIPNASTYQMKEFLFNNRRTYYPDVNEAVYHYFVHSWPINFLGDQYRSEYVRAVVIPHRLPDPSRVAAPRAAPPAAQTAPPAAPAAPAAPAVAPSTSQQAGPHPLAPDASVWTEFPARQEFNCRLCVPSRKAANTPRVRPESNDVEVVLDSLSIIKGTLRREILKGYWMEEPRSAWICKDHITNGQWAMETGTLRKECGHHCLIEERTLHDNHNNKELRWCCLECSVPLEGNELKALKHMVNPHNRVFPTTFSLDCPLKDDDVPCNHTSTSIEEYRNHINLYHANSLLCGSEDANHRCGLRFHNNQARELHFSQVEEEKKRLGRTGNDDACCPLCGTIDLWEGEVTGPTGKQKVNHYSMHSLEWRTMCRYDFFETRRGAEAQAHFVDNHWATTGGCKYCPPFSANESSFEHAASHLIVGFSKASEQETAIRSCDYSRALLGLAKRK